MIRRVLVANRGEIAVRIIRTCKEMGLETVAIYSAADRSSLHVRYADRAVCVGRAPALESYLNVDAILGAAHLTEADAIHPGYGFLAENAEFAAECCRWNLHFIGPNPEVIRMMGNKIAAREIAKKAGVPTVPGSEASVLDLVQAEKLCRELGFPILLKAASGGGGRGIRVVDKPDNLARDLATCQREATAAFGEGSIYVEKLIANARHVEVQVLGDQHGHCIHLGERDCSVQRSKQKLLEEAPCVVISDGLRQELFTAALAITRQIGYDNAGTIEFLVDRETEKFYFLEMNTRLQVEHPVTEALTGIDIVEQQIQVAAGAVLALRQEDIQFRGHAIEFRINAEDPAKGFLPNPGQITDAIFPGGPGIRVDTFCHSGSTIPPYYDSLLAKVVAHADTRERALNRLKAALEMTDIKGIATTIPLFFEFLEMYAFQSNQFNVFWVDNLFRGEK